jgi:uncharacterized protein involved in exopolysaccharide biosynthesis
VQFFESKVAVLTEELRQAEMELQDFETAHDITTIEKQENVLLEHIAESKAAADNARVEYEKAASKIQRLEESMNVEAGEFDFASTGDFDDASFPEGILLNLAELRKDREGLLLTELDESDRVRNIDDQMRALMGLVTSNLRSVTEEKKAAYDTRAEVLEELETRLDSLHERKMEWNALKRRCKLIENDYLLYRNKLEEAYTESALIVQEVGNVSVAQRAIDPFVPSGMRKTILFSFVTLAGFLAVLAWLAVAEFFDHRIYTGEALVKLLDCPTIAVVPVQKVDLLEESLI